MQGLFSNPIFFKHRLLERREYKRSKSSFWIKQMSLVWCVLIPLAWVAMVAFPEILAAFSPSFDKPKLLAALYHLSLNWLGALIFSYFIVLLATIGIATHSTSSLVTGEREKKTYESLHSTMMTSTEILNGRLMCGLWPVLRELVIVTPLALGLGALAGYGFKAFLCLLLLFSTVAFYGMVGLWSSYASKNTTQANRLAGGVCGSLLVGIPIVSLLSGNSDLLRLHPVFASGFLSEGFGPVLLVTLFHLLGASLLWLDSLRRERSAVRV